MITRDITLDDCILDLIDNSVDGAWRSEGSRPMGLANDADLSAYRIDISAKETQFSIRDNCGGMTLDDAVNHAFSFGRKALDDHDDYSIGVYGIGMKRAIFKIGRDISIRSTFLEKPQKPSSFAVPIDVKDWMKDDTPPWDFDLVEADDLPAPGVEIIVSDLTSGAAASFASPAFIQNLRRTIARDYSLHLNRGLKIFIEGVEVKAWNFELRTSEEFVPIRLEYEDAVEGDKVVVEIIGGMAAAPPDDAEPDESNEGDRRFGWYVVCNGRIVLAADKSEITGWGTDGWPQWHYQYAGFIGIILFTAAKAAALPLTTTKRSIDTTSEVFRRARPRMREVSKTWTAYTNSRKQALEEAKAKEASAKPVSIYEVRPQAAVALPKLAVKITERQANVHYSVPTARLKKLAQAMGAINMPYREVGLKSFEYTYDDMVGEE
jgi:hypothetical protein